MFIQTLLLIFIYVSYNSEDGRQNNENWNSKEAKGREAPVRGRRNKKISLMEYKHTYASEVLNFGLLLRVVGHSNQTFGLLSGTPELLMRHHNTNKQF